MITPNGRYLGRKPDEPDPMDKRFLAEHPEAARATLPPAIDLREKLPPCFSQGKIGSCGAQAGAGLMAALFPKHWYFSRLQIYYYTRIIEQTVSADSGVQTRDILKELKSIGSYSEDQ